MKAMNGTPTGDNVRTIDRHNSMAVLFADFHVEVFTADQIGAQNALKCSDTTTLNPWFTAF
jgi:prepilin-type processing-associated H-X9-DG protein